MVSQSPFGQLKRKDGVSVKTQYCAEAREYTKDEMQELFIAHIRGLVEYWSTVEEPGLSTRDRLSRFAFNMLVVLDSGTELPAFRLLPYPHPDDKEFLRSQGKKWFPEDGCDIAGHLHERLYRDGWR